MILSIRSILSLVTALAVLGGCAPISRYPAPPHIREGALAQSSRWAGSARRDLNEKQAAQKSLAALRIALKQNSRDAEKIAHVALGRFIEANLEGGQLRETQFTGPDGIAYTVRIEPEQGDWDPSLFNRLDPIRRRRPPASPLLQWDGWGVPLVGVSKPERDAEPFAPRLGYRLPVTVLAKMSLEGSLCRTSLRFINPESKHFTKTTRGGRRVAADLYTPKAQFFRHRRPVLSGLRWLFQVDRFSYPTRLIFLQPYDDQRIPVVLVHGLLSTPMMWGEVVNELQKDPLIRGSFQFWTFFYPTGQPVWLSSLDFRNDLRRAHDIHGLKGGMVLVGHSMGGIISRVQASSSGGMAFFNSLFGSDAPRAAKRLPDSALLQEAIFESNKNVGRVIFIAVPHQGSRFALARTAGFVASLIRLPNTFIEALADLSEVMATFNFRRPPTSIAGLAPNAPFLRALNERPIEVPHHSIIGDRGRGNSPNSSDGVVPYASAHLPTADSELIVPAGHGAFRHPMAIAEIRRILIEHLETMQN